MQSLSNHEKTRLVEAGCEWLAKQFEDRCATFDNAPLATKKAKEEMQLTPPSAALSLTPPSVSDFHDLIKNLPTALITDSEKTYFEFSKIVKGLPAELVSDLTQTFLEAKKESVLNAANTVMNAVAELTAGDMQDLLFASESHLQSYCHDLANEFNRQAWRARDGWRYNSFDVPPNPMIDAFRSGLISNTPGNKTIVVKDENESINVDLIPDFSLDQMNDLEIFLSKAPGNKTIVVKDENESINVDLIPDFSLNQINDFELFMFKAGIHTYKNTRRLNHRIKKSHLKITVPGKTEYSRIARASCPIFWIRNVRKQCRREREMAMYRAKAVGGQHKYCSQSALRDRATQNKRNEDILAKKAIRNPTTGQEFSLLDIAQDAKKNRCAEVYALATGLHAAAKDAGCTMGMLTLTAPREYHPNPMTARSSWDRKTNMCAAHKYISGNWAKLRLSLANKGIKLSGLRVCEPHADGCPHQHLFIAMPEGKRYIVLQEACDIFGHDFDDLFITKTERKTHALDWIEEDPKKGSLLSYLYPYIMKNSSFAGEEKIEGAKEGDEISPDRVDAWRSIWAIRSYQFFGVPSVGLWREARRIYRAKPSAANGFTADKMNDKREIPTDEQWREEQAHNGDSEADGGLADGAIEAAGEGRAKDFFNAMGGIAAAPRTEVKEKPISWWKTSTVSKYGEVTEKIIGVICKQGIISAKFQTRGLFEVVERIIIKVKDSSKALLKDSSKALQITKQTVICNYPREVKNESQNLKTTPFETDPPPSGAAWLWSIGAI